MYDLGTRRDRRDGKRRVWNRIAVVMNELCGGKKSLKSRGMAAIGLVGSGSGHNSLPPNCLTG